MKVPFKLWHWNAQSFIYPNVEVPFNIFEVAIARFRGPHRKENSEECLRCILFLHWERLQKRRPRKATKGKGK